jgi:hypothetical protein
MTKFVLEILDGEKAGTVVPLGEGRVQIGRRPDNDVVIPDEKCSGHHATVEFEDGRHVLRDSGSTNGTMIDGHRVTEVALSPGDVVQLGRVRVRFRAEGQPADLGELRVERIDAARLAHTRRRGSPALLVVLILIAAGVGAWLLFGRNFGEEGAGGPVVVRPLKVDGNLLPDTVANLEEGGGFELQPAPQAAPFEIALGRTRAHSGDAGLVATPIVGEGDARRFALARLSEPIAVPSGTPLEFSAFVRTAGEGRASVRAWFSSSADDRVIRTGTEPTSAPDDWQRLAIAVCAPTGFDRVRVELLALLPQDDSEVLVDDVAIVRVADAPAVAGNTRNGRVLVGAGSSFRVDGATEPTLIGVMPLVEDPVLSAVAEASVLAPSDAGLDLTVEPIDDVGFRFRFGDGAAARALRVLLPQDAVGVRTRGAGEGAAFEEQSAEFQAEAVLSVLFGAPDGRGLFTFTEPVELRGQLLDTAYAMDVVGSRELALRTVFIEEATRAKALEREAEAARDAGRVGDALNHVRELVRVLPHDVAVVRSAIALRGEILEEQEERIRELQRDSVSAAFFEARVGYERVLAGIDEIFERYGEANVQRLDELRALQERMQQGIAELDRRAGAAHARQLGALAASLDAAGDERLAAVLRSYVERHYQGLDDADTVSGDREEAK